MDAAFASLLESAGKVVEDPGPDLLGIAAVAKMDPATVKSTFAAVVTALVEMAKTNQSTDGISGFLEENGYVIRTTNFLSATLNVFVIFVLS